MSEVMSEEVNPARDPRARVLTWLFAVAVIVSLAALFAHIATRQSTEGQFEPLALWPDFAQSIETIREVEIETKDVFMTIQPGPDGTWGMKERGGYPVRPEKLRETIWGLGDMKLVEAKTRRADRHKKLGLVAPAEDGDAVAIRIFAEGRVPMASVLMGIAEGEETLDGELLTYVRREGEDATWLASSRLESEASLEEWLDLDVLDVDADRIKRVTSYPGDASQGGETFTVERPGRDTYNFALMEMPEGEEMTGPTAANGLGRALVALTPSDVRKAADIGFTGSARVHYETFEGLGLIMQVRRFEGDFWITMAAELRPVEVAPEPLEGEPLEGEPLENEEEEPILKTNLEREAARINARARGWAFKIPEWKGNQLTLARASLIKQEEE